MGLALSIPSVPITILDPPMVELSWEGEDSVKEELPSRRVREWSSLKVSSKKS
jgi:hypothetical protein